MPQAFETFNFHSPGIFAGQTGVVDRENYVIRGVSVITGGIEAEGHNLQVDDTTLKQLQSSAKARGKIPVTLDHGSGVKDLNGYITGFRMDGDKLRGDWHMLKTHDESEKMLERAEVMPECFGLSVAFKGPKEGVPIGGGKMAARCEKLLSVDVVTRPAANATGLFGADPVDKPNNDMPTPTETAASAAPAEPTNQQIMEALNALSGRLDQHESFLNEQFTQEPTLEDLYNASDEDLKSVGLTRAEVEAAVQEAIAASNEGNTVDVDGKATAGAGTEAGTAGATMPGAGAPVAASAGVDVSAPATFEQLSKRLIELETKLREKELAEKKDSETKEFSAVQSKILTLAAQRDEAAKENVELKSKISAFEVAMKTGVRPVRAGSDNGVRMFGADGGGELHQFQARVKQLVDSKTCKTNGEAILFAQKENPALHADWVQHLNPKAQIKDED